jgi:hypothetical protein
MNESSLPPLRDLPPGRLDQRAAHLRSEIAGKHQARLRVARPVLVAVIAAFVALALVPIGGASLGQRAVDGVTSLWAPPANGIEPANQPALDAAADDAQAVAGAAYYTAASVNDSANTVDVYLAGAPQSIIDQLQAKHPGTYVIHNDAAHPLSQLRRIQHALPLGPLQTASGSVDLVDDYPTSDGYLKVGVEGNGDVQAAQKALDALYGPGIVEVYGGAQMPNNLVWH